MSQVIIVTGASRGIGLAVAKYLLAQKPQHKLVVTSRSEEALQTLKRDSGRSDDVQVVAGDMSDEATARRIVDVAVDTYGRVDGLVLNHGTLGEVKRVADGTVEGWRTTFETNLFSLVNLIQAAVPLLRKTSGRIIMTSSGAATNGYATWGAYGASKAALNHLALTLKNEEPGITTVSIRPGIVDSEMQREIREVHHERMDEKDRTRFKTAHEEGKLLKPEQPGNVIARLAVDADEALSGQFLSWNDEKLARYQD